MFRAVVLLIGLTLAVGPVELLCNAWCHPQAPAATQCHHAESTSSPIAAGDNNCDTGVLSAGTYLRQEVRPVGPSSNAGHAVLVLRYQFAELATDARSGQVTWA